MVCVCVISRFLDLLNSWLGTIALAGRYCLCWSFPFVRCWKDMPRERREAALLSWATSRVGMLRKVPSRARPGASIGSRHLALAIC